MLSLRACARSGSGWRLALAALAVVLLLSGCASSSGQAGGGAADPAGSASQKAAPAGCGHDQVMGRPCPQERADVVQSHRPRYKTDQGEAYEQYNGDTYHGKSGGYCLPRLKESYQAYKACVRY